MRPTSPTNVSPPIAFLSSWSSSSDSSRRRKYSHHADFSPPPFPLHLRREEPPRPVFVRPLGLVCREQSEEASHDLANLLETGRQFFAGLARLGCRSWQGATALGFQFLAAILQPIPQPQR